jgi:hypothetical protein
MLAAGELEFDSSGVGLAVALLPLPPAGVAARGALPAGKLSLAFSGVALVGAALFNPCSGAGAELASGATAGVAAADGALPVDELVPD